MTQQESAIEVLLVDDDTSLGKLLTDYLQGFGIRLKAVTHATECMQYLRRNQPDIVILDLMLPGKDGLEICKDIRAEFDLPILMLTARGELADKVLGLELGADDYMAKPFEPRELVARLRSLVRRSSQGFKNKRLAVTGLEIETETQLVILDDKELLLTAMEFHLLRIFMESNSKILSRSRLLDLLKGFDSAVYDRSVDMLVCRLREKLGEDAKNPRFIKTIRTSGYKFVGRT